MTALLTDNLPLLAGAPNGIKRLRELILELAVRGKLVPQNLNDEPAAELLKRISEEKARLMAAGKIKNTKPTNEDPAEILYEIPSTWAVASLGQVVEIVRGITFPASEKSKEPELGRVACLRTANVQDKIEWDDLLYIRESFVSRHDQYVKPHDIVMSMANSRELVGKVALIGSELKQKTTIGGFLGVLRPVLIEPRFVMALLRTPHARNALIESSSQTTNIANVSLGKLRPLPFAIPPLAEQRRIVSKVDELIALCDRLEARQAGAQSAHAQLVKALLDSLTQTSDATDFTARWQLLAEHFQTLFTTETSIDALKQSLLQLAVMGKLVQQDSNDEPARKLLNRIAQEKSRLIAEGKLKKQKSLPEVGEEEKPYALPSNWKWTRFDSISNTRLGKMLDKAKNKGELRPYLRNTNVQWFNFEIDDLKRMRFEEHELDEYRVLPGDLVICEGGEPGRCAVWRGDIENMFIQKALHRARPWLDISPFFLQFCLRTAARSGFLAQFFTGATIKHFSGEKLAKYPVPLPPLAEQHRIVAKVDQLMDLCDQLKTRLTQARQLNEQMASTLVERALADDGKHAPIVTDQKTARILLAAEVAHKLHAQHTFGQRKLQKVVYLAEHAARLGSIQGSYLRNVAGPHDRHLMNQVEAGLQRHQWYERINRETVGHAYRPLSQAGKHRQAYNRTWSASEQANIEQVIELMRDWDTDRCEMTVTLYAAWNDFIIEGRPVTDEVIVDEVMHRWNEAKLRFSMGEWMAVLTEMKQHGLLTPTGFGKRTNGGTLTMPGFE